jgi:NTP pyrophosphatase (non-canonical NTP hydrolase)
MTFEEYQEQARKTAIYPGKYSVIYPTLGLTGEAGEVAEKVKKTLRGNKKFDADFKKLIIPEIGDVLWYLANLCEDLDLSLDTVAKYNLNKLEDRKQRGVIDSSGDNR